MNAQDKQIKAELEKRGIAFNVHYTGTTKRDDWDCYAFICELNSERFEYYKGLGHGVTKADLNRLSNKGKFAPLRVWMKEKGIESRHEELLSDNKEGFVIKPTEAELIYSLISDSSADDMSFNDWCGDYGYDTDSRKALDIYLACQANTQKLYNALSRETIETFQTILEDY